MVRPTTLDEFADRALATHLRELASAGVRAEITTRSGTAVRGWPDLNEGEVLPPTVDVVRGASINDPAAIRVRIRTASIESVAAYTL